MRLMIQYLKRYKLLFCLNAFSVFGFALVELGIPTIVSDMVDRGVVLQDPSFLMQRGILILIISIVGVAGTILLGYCSAKLSTLVVRDIRNDVFRKAQSFSHYEMNQFGVSSLITRTSNDAFQVLMFLNTILRTAMLTPVMIVVSISLTMMTSMELSYVILATVPFVVLGVVIVGKISGPISEKQQHSLDEINRIFRENLTGIRVIRSFQNDAYEAKRFEKENSFFTKQSKKLFQLMSSTDPVFFLLMNFAAIGIYLVASVLIGNGTLQAGKLIAFMEYLFHAMLSIMLFCMVFMMYPRANVSAKRILEVLETDSSIVSHPSNVKQDEKRSVVFDHVCFAYPDGEEAVLKDISFEVHAGETIAFIGSTGSGKSSLISLIPRFYDVCDGEVLVNGVNVKDFDVRELRDQIGFVSQKANLFSATIADNIRFGKEDATDEEVIHAAKVAQAYDFIMEKPKQFDEWIVEGATNVSGGQKQRLSIARALVRKPQIYIYDDSFSALDFKTDAALRKALKDEVGDAIVIIVAQRVSTIMDADQIVVLNEGKVVGKGTHQELLKNCEIYYEIASSQLSEEELAYGK